MVTSSNALFVSTRRSHWFGLAVAAGILFVVGIGGTGALWGAYTGATAQASISTVHPAA
jgi:hypothetical protein